MPERSPGEQRCPPQKWEVREGGAALPPALGPLYLTSYHCPQDLPSVRAPHCFHQDPGCPPPSPLPLLTRLPLASASQLKHCLLLEAAPEPHPRALVKCPPLTYLLPNTGAGCTTITGSLLCVPLTPCPRSLLRTGVQCVQHGGSNALIEHLCVLMPRF